MYAEKMRSDSTVIHIILYVLFQVFSRRVLQYYFQLSRRFALILAYVHKQLCRGYPVRVRALPIGVHISVSVAMHISTVASRVFAILSLLFTK